MSELAKPWYRSLYQEKVVVQADVMTMVLEYLLACGMVSLAVVTGLSDFTHKGAGSTTGSPPLLLLLLLLELDCRFVLALRRTFLRRPAASRKRGSKGRIVQCVLVLRSFESAGS